MSQQSQQVYIVDDEPSVRKALLRLMRSSGYEAVAYTSAGEFMAQRRADAPGCLILDLAMPGVTGLELQQWLAQTNDPMPIIFITGHGDIPTSVNAMKAGAVDFLTKPVNDRQLLAAVEEALRCDCETRTVRTGLASIRQRLTTLTPREREVLEHVVSGQLNKQIAGDLGTVEKTIKVHRARVMQKMGAASLAELVRLAMRVGIGHTSPADSWQAPGLPARLPSRASPRL